MTLDRGYVDRGYCYGRCYVCDALGLKPCACCLWAEMLIDLTLDPDTPRQPTPKRVRMDSPVAWPNGQCPVNVDPHTCSKYQRSRIVSYAYWEGSSLKSVARSLLDEFTETLPAAKRIKLAGKQTLVTDYYM